MKSADRPVTLKSCLTFLTLEVTAFNPLSGRSRKLTSPELEEILAILAAFERHQDTPRLAADLRALGIDPEWYDRRGKPSRPLFVAQAGGAQCSGDSLRDLLAAARSYRSSGELRVPPRSRDKLVFVVDDDESFRDFVAFVVGREGFRFDVFSSGVELLRQLQKHSSEAAPDLVLLDLMMPELGGFETLRALQHDALPGVPVLILTARDMDQTTVDSIQKERNVAGFLRKPFDTAALVGLVHQAVGTQPS